MSQTLPSNPIDIVSAIVEINDHQNSTFEKEIDESENIELQFQRFSASVRADKSIFHTRPTKPLLPPLSEKLDYANTVSNQSENEASAKYRQMFFNATDYVGLFVVNRPTQTTETGVETIRDTEHKFQDLFSDIEDARQFLKDTLENDLGLIGNALSKYMQHRLELLQKTHEQNVSHVRRAYRAKLADHIARITFDVQKEREGRLQKIKYNHEQQIMALENAIADGKGLFRHADANILKLRDHVPRLQLLMKRHGIIDIETGVVVLHVIDDQRVRQSELLEHYQKVLQARDNKIKHLREQLKKLQGELAYKNEIKTICLEKLNKSVNAEFSEVDLFDNNVGNQKSSASKPSKPSARTPQISSAATLGNGQAKRSGLTESQQNSYRSNFEQNSKYLAKTYSRAATALSSMGDGNLSEIMFNDSYDFQTSNHMSQIDQVHQLFESKIIQMNEAHLAKVASITKSTEEIENALCSKFYSIQEANLKANSVLNQSGKTRFVISETAKLLFPLKTKFGIPTATQCDRDAEDPFVPMV
ncbi:hypothetical protein MT418_006415 [Batrachochytrium dendrobatidis]